MATTLGERVKIAREMRQLGQRELAKLIGVSKDGVGSIERGDPNRKPLATTIARIAQVTRVSGHWLLTGEGDPELVVMARVGSMPFDVRKVSEPNAESTEIASSMAPVEPDGPPVENQQKRPSVRPAKKK